MFEKVQQEKGISGTVATLYAIFQIIALLLSFGTCVARMDLI